MTTIGRVDSEEASATSGVTPNPVIPNPDAVGEEVAEAENRVLSTVVELIWVLVDAHQSAIANLDDMQIEYLMFRRTTL